MKAEIHDLPDAVAHVVAKRIVADNQWKRNFAKALRVTIISEDIPGIDDPRLVTVSFDNGRANPEDMLLVIEVTGLFVRPDRPKKVRDRLAYALKECGKAHNNTLGCEVLIHIARSSAFFYSVTPFVL